MPISLHCKLPTTAFNLIDGIDGLAGSLGMISILFFGTWFMLVGKMYYSFFCFAFAGGYLAFLNYNWAPSKIFMGDTGSLLLGFFIASSTILFIDTNYYLLESSYKFNGSIATGVAIIVVPLYDTIRVFIKRIMAGRSPMSPDKNHLHHVLLNLGYKHAGATVILIMINLSFVGIAIFLKDYNDRIALPAVIATAIIMGAILDYRFGKMIKSKRKGSGNGASEVFLTKSA